MLVDDDGFEGVVISTIGLSGLRFEPKGHGRTRLIARAGEPFDTCVARAVELGLSGIESLSGIPGSVGATPIQNVGAYGQEVSETIVEVRALERSTGRGVTLSSADCEFAYRDSALKRDPGRFVVVEVTFELTDSPPRIKYAELERALGDGVADAAAVRKAVVAIRRSKSMVIETEDENRRSVGSFFLNPVVDEARARTIVEALVRDGVVARPDEVPVYSAGGGMRKLSAAWLIERAGFGRGYGDGGVGISTRHTLALVNRGRGTTKELLALAELIRRGVESSFGVSLSLEPVRLGAQASP